MSALTFKGLNLQISANRKSHHTDKYISKELILRRGQIFKITLSFNRPIRRGEHIRFTAQTGPRPEESTNTKAVFPLSMHVKSRSWKAVPTGSTHSSKSMEIALSSPSNAIVGRYKLSFQIFSGGIFVSHKLGDIILIFNAWASGDDVYMANNDERQEYILNDAGIIYIGNQAAFRGFPWDYGQFEEQILTICLALLDRNLNHSRDKMKDISRRNDPIYVGRVCSAMVNSNDENGVLSGRWREPYTGGATPQSWNGSVAILRKWYNEKFQPVKYGQCWVFAGVLCTVLRCLGIPTRTITNFESAHDTDGNLSIDEYFNSLGKRQDHGDSVWNFHVWNEAWFTRRDLGSSYNGWQALDATPQEESEGIYQCGPTSVKAIKEGDVDLNYDAPFLFAEVNADRTHWIISKDGNKRAVFSNSSSIGKFISTKAVGSNSRLDITDNYKYPEGSNKEREVYKKACSKLFNGNEFAEDISTLEWLSDELSDEFSDNSDDQESKPQIFGQFKLSDPALIGQDIQVNMIIKNLTSDNKTIQIKISAYSIKYTRATGETIMKNSTSTQLSPNEEKQIPLKISYSQYKQYLNEDNMIQVAAVCEDDHGQKLLVDKDIVLIGPALSIKVPEKVVLKQTITVEVSFDNPLSEVVKNCVLLLEGSGLLKEQFKIKLEDVKPLEKIKIPVQITPFTPGTRQLLANLVCDHFSNVKGFQSIVVAQAP